LRFFSRSYPRLAHHFAELDAFGGRALGSATAHQAGMVAAYQFNASGAQGSIDRSVDEALVFIKKPLLRKKSG